MSGGFLVTGANGDIAEAICGILREAFPAARIDGADAGGPRPGEGLFDAMHALPRADDADFVSAFRSLADDGGYATIIPTVEAELARLATAADEPLVAGQLLMVRKDLLRMFLDKMATAQWLHGEGLNPPATVAFADADALSLPIVVKPRHGRGSRGVEIVRSPDHLAYLRSLAPADMIAQEYVGDEDGEYTCAVIRLNGALRSLTLKRRLAGGRTVVAEVAAVAAIDDLVARIAEACDLEGAINVQLRLTPEGPRVFEVNPRFSSTVRMRHLLGFQDLVWAVNESLPDYIPRPGQVVYRLSRELVFGP